jgi:orotidine-5'-phosphate decarboxylase
MSNNPQGELMQQPLSARERLIVALDCPTPEMSADLVEKLGESVRFYKVGWRLFLQRGMGFVSDLRSAGKNVFLDLKMDDIAETIETAVATLPENIAFLTISGGSATARAAVKGRGDRANPKILALTLLSSLNEQDLKDLASATGMPTVEDYVLHRAGEALKAGCEGLIASGQSIGAIRARYGPEPIIVSPGIRPSGSPADDHKRSATPKEAIQLGADYLVVGRPIRLAVDPVEAANRIVAEIEEGLNAR